ncbi:MAG: DNA polymerase III subunit delta' [Alphaproteobacteria bacterium]
MTEIPESDRLEDLPHPRETLDLVGHEAEEALFAGIRAGGRMPHAWLICGPQGIGKATLAYRMARAVLRHGVGGGPADSLSVPGDDPVARRIAAQAHPDLLILRRPWDERTKRLKTVLNVDEVRRLNGFLAQHAGEGGWRVVIVDAADDMNANAANALLKLLEEPPQKVLLLLVAHAPAKLLPTIRSRCRTLRLRPLAPDAVTEIVRRHGTAELSGEDAALLAWLSRGSAGRALMLAAHGGLEIYKQITGLMSGLPEMDTARLHRLADQAGGRGAEQSFALTGELMSEAIEAVIHMKSGDAAGPPGSAGEGLGRAAALGRLDRWLEAWDKVRTVFGETATLNLDRKQALLSAGFLMKTASREM